MSLTTPHSRCPQVTLGAGGLQTHWPMPLQSGAVDNSQLPQLTGLPQLLVWVPHWRDLHVRVIASSTQTHVPLAVQLKPGWQDPQSFGLPQESGNVPHVLPPHGLEQTIALHAPVVSLQDWFAGQAPLFGPQLKVFPHALRVPHCREPQLSQESHLPDGPQRSPDGQSSG